LKDAKNHFIATKIDKISESVTPHEIQFKHEHGYM